MPRFIDSIQRGLGQGLGPADSPTFAGLTIDALSGVLKATAGAVAGGAAHSELATIGANDHHNAITLDTNADTLLSLSTQALGLDTKAANLIFSGPTTGAAAVPTFRAMVAADLGTTLTPTFAGLTLTAFSGFVKAATGVLSAAAIADGDLPSALTGKSYNALTLAALSTGFSVAGGTTSKTLTVDETVSISAKANLAASISDGDITHAPDGNSVFDALALKAPLSGATLVSATINALTPTAAAVGFTLEGGTTSKTLTVDETVAMSSKAPKASPVITGMTTFGDAAASTGGLQGVNTFSVSVPTATPTTLFDCTTFQAYNDALLIIGGNDNTGAFVGLTTRSGDGVAVVVLLLGKGTGLTLTMSGTNVQLTHAIGVTSTFYGKVLRIAGL